MRRSKRFALVIMFCACGCGQKTTTQLVEDLKAPAAETRIKAARTLAERKDDAAQIVPALIAALQDPHTDVRRCAATGLGAFGDQAREAIPPLQKSLLDSAPSVRKAARHSLAQIDPASAEKAGGRK